jgi:hypothetical protein
VWVANRVEHPLAHDFKIASIPSCACKVRQEFPFCSEAIFVSFDVLEAFSHRGRNLLLIHRRKTETEKS